jgi:hypothetical protein
MNLQINDCFDAINDLDSYKQQIESIQNKYKDQTKITDEFSAEFIDLCNLIHKDLTDKLNCCMKRTNKNLINYTLFEKLSDSDIKENIRRNKQESDLLIEQVVKVGHAKMRLEIFIKYFI